MKVLSFSTSIRTFKTRVRLSFTPVGSHFYYNIFSQIGEVDKQLLQCDLCTTKRGMVMQR